MKLILLLLALASFRAVGQAKTDTVQGIAITYSNDSIPAYMVTKVHGWLIKWPGGALMGSAEYVWDDEKWVRVKCLDFPEPVYDLNFKPLVRNTIERFYIPVRKLGF